MLGNKQFELSNLPIAIGIGNVLTTVSDRKIPHTSDNITIDYYTADITSAQDYYAFGMLMPGRNWSSDSYKYGFNGKENDNEIFGAPGTFQDYGMRMYDSRVGRFWGVDPLTKQYPELTPYQFASNRPIDGIDLDGEEWSKADDKMVFKVVIVNLSDRADINLYGVKNELTKQYKAMFGDDFEIQARVVYGKDFKVGKNEALLKICNPEEFNRQNTKADALDKGRVIRVKSNSIDTWGAFTDGDNSGFAEEIGHTGGLGHPFELRDKNGGLDGTNLLQMYGVKLGNFMSYPNKDADIWYKEYEKENDELPSDNQKNEQEMEYIKNPQPATFGQKRTIEINYDYNQLNQGEAE